jgi:hypothetical protein
MYQHVKKVQTSFALQKGQLHLKVIPFKEKAAQLVQLRSQYAAYIARLNAARLNAARLNAARLNARPQPRFTKKALLVGINYVGTGNALYGCINDVNAVNAHLNSKGFTCQLITDNTALKPTRENILNAFKLLLVNAIAGDMLFFHYSGHGSYVRDTHREEIDGYDEAIVSRDMKYILDDEFKSLLVNHLKKDVTLVALFDSCHSGTMLDLKYQYMDSLHGADVVYPKNLATAGKVYMMSGCMDQQTSADAFIDKRAQGAMTWACLECLKKKPTHTWRELLRSMRTLLKDNGYSQIPQFSAGTLVDIDAQVFI